MEKSENNENDLNKKNKELLESIVLPLKRNIIIREQETADLVNALFNNNKDIIDEYKELCNLEENFFDINFESFDFSKKKEQFKNKINSFAEKIFKEAGKREEELEEKQKDLKNTEKKLEEKQENLKNAKKELEEKKSEFNKLESVAKNLKSQYKEIAKILKAEFRLEKQKFFYNNYSEKYKKELEEKIEKLKKNSLSKDNKIELLCVQKQIYEAEQQLKNLENHLLPLDIIKQYLPEEAKKIVEKIKTNKKNQKTKQEELNNLKGEINSMNAEKTTLLNEIDNLRQVNDNELQNNEENLKQINKFCKEINEMAIDIEYNPAVLFLEKIKSLKEDYFDEKKISDIADEGIQKGIAMTEIVRQEQRKKNVFNYFSKKTKEILTILNRYSIYSDLEKDKIINKAISFIPKNINDVMVMINPNSVPEKEKNVQSQQPEQNLQPEQKSFWGKIGDWFKKKTNSVVEWCKKEINIPKWFGRVKTGWEYFSSNRVTVSLLMFGFGLFSGLHSILLGPGSDALNYLSETILENTDLLSFLGKKGSILNNVGVAVFKGISGLCNITSKVLNGGNILLDAIRPIGAIFGLAGVVV